MGTILPCSQFWDWLNHTCANRVASIVLQAYALKVYSYLKVELKPNKWCFLLTPAIGLQAYKHHDWTLF